MDDPVRIISDYSSGTTPQGNQLDMQITAAEVIIVRYDYQIKLLRSELF